MVKGFKVKRDRPPPTKRPDKPREKKNLKQDMIAPVGGMSLMDELAKKFNKSKQAGMQ